MVDTNELLNFSKDAFGISVDEKFEYDVSQLDYGYVKTASDIPQLKKLLAVLRSGKEGYYPDLEKSFEDRIIELDSSYAQARSSKQSKISFEELMSLKDDLKDWGNGIREHDEKFQSSGAIWPGKGSRKYVQPRTLEFYNNSLSLYPQQNVYTNRSLVYIRLNRFLEAEADAISALAFNNEKLNFKAFLRRGVARLKLKKYDAARDDLEKAKKYRPDDADVQKYLSEIEKALESSEPKSNPTILTVEKPNVKRLEVIDVDSDDE
ncbi:Sperm associated antigen 1 [Phlyctochytrium planicorne]|nr:Sperm associated antigen 1 [Phlyctochytrium planicorne]